MVLRRMEVHWKITMNLDIAGSFTGLSGIEDAFGIYCLLMIPRPVHGMLSQERRTVYYDLDAYKKHLKAKLLYDLHIQM